MGDQSQANNKRIAKNTLLLYFRMFLMMAIGLYTSRVVLAVLGEVDFGIYNVVGGFVSIFTMISGAMSSATQRFLSFEIGKGADGRVKELFSTAVIIHVFLALIILLLAETVGLWFVNEKMNFPEDRYSAANWVFQFSVLTFIIKVISVPYNAVLVAYERMSAFAYVSIIEVSLNLMVVFLLAFSSIDKLVMYAAFLSLIAVIIRFIYGIYVKRNFSECNCVWKTDAGFQKQMVSFVSWNLIGSIAGVAKEQGINVVLNIFFGATINAARGIAYQVMHAVSLFSTNFQLALNPQIVKLYASNEKEKMFRLVFRGSRLSYLLVLMLSLPIIIETPFVLGVWLKDVPDYTVLFLRLVLISTMIDSLSHTLIASMHASGKVRDYQIVVGGISLMTLPTVYIFFCLGYPPYVAMVIGIVFSFICHFARLILLKYSIQLPINEYLIQVTFRVMCVSVLSGIIPFYVSTYFEYTWCGFVVVVLICILSTSIFSYAFGLSSSEKSILREKLSNIFHKKMLL